MDTQCANQDSSNRWCQLVAERATRLGEGAQGAVAELSPQSATDTASLLTQLGVPNATPGKSIYRHGAVETWSGLASAAEWGWYDMSVPPEFNAALFAGGIDSWQPFAGDNAARVDGVWQMPDTGADLARAGYWAVPTTSVAPGAAWLLSFAYRTSGAEPSASVWIGSNRMSFHPRCTCPERMANGAAKQFLSPITAQPLTTYARCSATGASRPYGLMNFNCNRSQM
ncbi:MAG: hypothetical protein IPK16_12145 [Anaerolineales bacterium]|nr:hypothetical protein [Anaerolineales bacterium]